MSEFDYYDFDDEYRNIIILDEYEGDFSLIMGQKGKDETAYKRWGKLNIGKKDEEKYTKDMPWKLKLGDKQTAIGILTFFLQQLDAENNPKQETDDIPF